MKVFITGLIYFNGCRETVKRAYAPDGRAEGHFASLWIEANQVKESATEWWSDFRETRRVEGVDVIEFRIPDDAAITFPDEGSSVSCVELDKKLPKLKKKKHDEPEEDFDVDPATAETIAEVTIRGGEIRPRRFKDMGLVQWTIANPSAAQITVALKDVPGQSGIITLETPAQTEIVFSNTHNLFLLNANGHEAFAGNHVALFIKLNPGSDGIVVSNKPSGNAGQLKTTNAILNHMRKTAHTEGETPPCCKTLPIHG